MLPQNEIDAFTDSLNKNKEYLDTENVEKLYSSKVFKTISDPYSEEIASCIKNAIEAKQPYSVVRVGDGEANILAYDFYHDTPELNQFSVDAIIKMQSDCFLLNHNWMLILKEMMLSAVLQADIVGVLGLWTPKKNHAVTIEKKVEKLSFQFLKDYRGVSGQWRGRDYMIQMAQRDYLRDKIIAPAHLYLAVLSNLDKILSPCSAVYVLSNRDSVVEKLSTRFQNSKFEFIQVGDTKLLSGALPEQPFFFDRVSSALPEDMSGCLCLIGAGPWAEIYCSWVKQRGGVGVDIGSGFDLLDGEVTRPVHNSFGSDRLEKYKL